MKTDYALRVLVALGLESKTGKVVPLRELAEQNDIPKKFLEQIMIELRKKGWVKSTLGKAGGFQLAKDSDQIRIGEVIRHFDGVLAPIHCVSVGGYRPCSQEGRCRFRRLFMDARNYLVKLFDHTSLATVLKSSPVSQFEVFNSMFIEGDGI